MFDEKKLKEIYDKNADVLDDSFDEYVQSAYGSAVTAIKTDAFQNRALIQTRDAFPDYYACLRRSGDSDMEIAVFNVPETEYRTVHDKVNGIINILNPKWEFYLGIHVVLIHITQEHYPQYFGLKNSAQLVPSPINNN